jgi:acetyl-CoA carboxylase carboxyltransferase component
MIKTTIVIRYILSKDKHVMAEVRAFLSYLERNELIDTSKHEDVTSEGDGNDTR